MSEKKPKQVFIEGAISPEFISNSIAKHQSKKDIGAHSIFLGQVRNDVIENKEVIAIDYSCYEEMAIKIFHEIRESIFAKYDLTCMHIYHSIGNVKTGEICLFVFTSSKQRKVAIDACEEIVEQIKKQTPIWGKEMFDDEEGVWKINNK